MTNLGPFRLLRVASTGSSGDVFAAEHSSGLPVAIKVLPRKSSVIALHEIRATAALRHPNVVRVLDYGEVPEGTPGLAAHSVWYAMEWAGGGTLADRAPLSWSELHPGFAGLLSALAWLHGRGQLHRDIKPSNVLLPGPTDPRGGWKLADFGIAWTRDAQPSPESGTPHYMAPEQLFRGRLGPWTDLYGFGATVWTVVTGRLAFTDQGPALVEAILNRQPGPYVPRIDVPGALYPWLRRLLAKDYEDRFQYAIEALEALPPLDAGLWAPTPLPAGRRTQTVPTPTVPTPTWGVTPPARPPAPSTPGGVGSRRPVPEAPPPDPEVTPLQYLPAVGASAIGLSDPPLVAQASARNALWDALKTCFERNQLTRIALTGPAGSGRLRLAHWLAQAAHAAGLCRSDTLSHHGTPEDGVVGWIRRIFRFQGTNPRADLGRIGPTLLAWAEGRGADDARGEAWAALIEALDASDGPRRVIIVDQANLSRETGAFFDWVATRGPRPWLVLEIREVAVDLPEIRVNPLSEGELVRIGGGLGLSPVAAARIAEQSGGSPGVFMDICSALSRSGDWAYSSQGLEIRGSLAATTISPDTFPGSSEAAGMAAVLAPAVNIIEWQEACRVLGIDPVAEMGALLTHLVIPVDARTWRFRDPQLARAILSKQSDVRRLHAIASMVVAGDDEFGNERRAIHLVEAGLFAEARPALLRAVDRAVTRFDIPALARITDLLARAAEDDPTARACERYCVGKLARWRVQPAEEAWLEVEKYVDAAPDWVVRSRIERALLPVPGPRSLAARALAEQALALALARGTVSIQIEARLFLAKLYLNHDATVALAHAEASARDALALGDERLIADASNAGGAAEVYLNHPERAEEKLTIALAAATRAGTRGLRGVILSEIANVHFTTGHLERALGEFEQASAELGRLGHPTFTLTEASRALVELRLGREDDARRRLENALYIARSQGRSWVVALIQLTLLLWEPRDLQWRHWDERWNDAKRLLDAPVGDPEVARVAESVAAATEAAGDSERAERVRAIVRHVRGA